MMKRRDLLLLRTGAGWRTVDLNCEQLYMRYLDSQMPTGILDRPDDRWAAEPDPQFDRRPAAELFERLREELAAAHVLRLVDRQWLADDDLRVRVDALVAEFTSRGGRVEMVTTSRVPRDRRPLDARGPRHR